MVWLKKFACCLISIWSSFQGWCYVIILICSFYCIDLLMILSSRLLFSRVLVYGWVPSARQDWGTVRVTGNSLTAVTSFVQVLAGFGEIYFLSNKKYQLSSFFKRLSLWDSLRTGQNGRKSLTVWWSSERRFCENFGLVYWLYSLPIPSPYLNSISSKLNWEDHTMIVK